MNRSDADLTFASPPDATADATGPSGATVTYPLPAATDLDDTTPPAVACTLALRVGVPDRHDHGDLHGH